MDSTVKLLVVPAALTLVSCAADNGRLSIRPIADPLAAAKQRGTPMLQEGRGLLALGSVGLALEAFRKALRDEPASKAEALAGIAACYERMGRHDLSRVNYEAALAVEPGNILLLNSFAASLDNQGLRVEAAQIRAEAAARQAAAVTVAASDVARTGAAAPSIVPPEFRRAPSAVMQAALPPLAPAASITVSLPPARPAAPEPLKAKTASSRVAVAEAPKAKPALAQSAVIEALKAKVASTRIATIEAAKPTAAPAEVAAIAPRTSEPRPPLAPAASITASLPPARPAIADPPKARAESTQVAVIETPKPKPDEPQPLVPAASVTVSLPPARAADLEQPKAKAGSTQVAKIDRAQPKAEPAQAAEIEPPQAKTEPARTAVIELTKSMPQSTQIAVAEQPKAKPGPTQVTLGRLKPAQLEVVERPKAKTPARVTLGQPAVESGPRLERMSMGEVALVTQGGPIWRPPVGAEGRQTAAVRFVPLRPAYRETSVRLLNAARHQGLAARTRVALGSKGWDRVRIGDAGRVRERSLVLYSSATAAAAHRLARQFGFLIAKEARPGPLTVLLGRDAVRRSYRKG